MGLAPLARTDLELDFDRNRLAIARMHRLARRRVLPLRPSDKLNRLPSEELRLLRQLDAGVKLVVDLDESVLPVPRARFEANLLARMRDALRATSSADRWRELRKVVVDDEGRRAGDVEGGDEADLGVADVEERVEGRLESRNRLRDDGAL